MKLKFVVLLCICLLGLCDFSNALNKQTEEQIQEELKQLQQQFDEGLSQPGGMEEFLNSKNDEENQTGDEKCVSKHYLACKEENREDCIKKSYYQMSCVSLRCGFKLNKLKAEVYGSCIQRQCISDSDEVQKLSLQTYQCLYADKYNPKNIQERQTEYEQILKEFLQEFEEEKSEKGINLDQKEQEFINRNKGKEAECFNKYLFSKKDIEHVKQMYIQTLCLITKCDDKDDQPTAEIVGSCIQNQCKSDTEQQKQFDYELYQCLYLAKYNSKDDKYVLEKTTTTEQATYYLK
ncbi:hypothetical protein ABPG74_003691 [Tetrahymena malaccensis]